MASRATKNFMLGGALVGFVGIVYNFTYSKMKTVRGRAVGPRGQLTTRRDGR